MDDYPIRLLIHDPERCAWAEGVRAETRRLTAETRRLCRKRSRDAEDAWADEAERTDAYIFAREE